MAGESTQVSDPLTRLELTHANSIKQVVIDHLLNGISGCGLEVSRHGHDPDVVDVSSLGKQAEQKKQTNINTNGIK